VSVLILFGEEGNKLLIFARGVRVGGLSCGVCWSDEAGPFGCRRTTILLVRMWSIVRVLGVRATSHSLLIVRGASMMLTIVTRLVVVKVDRWCK